MPSGSELESRISKDTLAGLSGAAGKIIAGHPFETLKIRMQCHAVAQQRQSISITPKFVLEARFLCKFEEFDRGFDFFEKSVE
jgi:hypothetical protein